MKTQLADLISSLEPEDVPVKKEIPITPSRLDALLAAYQEVNAEFGYTSPDGDWWYRDPYPMALRALTPLKPIASEDLLYSIVALPHIPNINIHESSETYPAFIGVLMNLCQESPLTIHSFKMAKFAEYYGVPDTFADIWCADDVRHYQEVPSTKKLILLSSTGYAPCSKMAAGIVHIQGNTSGVGYRQRGGEIIIDGDVTQWAGHHMQGGILRINGTLKGNLGQNAEWGEIHAKRVEGNVGKGSGRVIIHIDELIGEIDPGGATVYVAGKKVYEWWKAV